MKSHEYFESYTNLAYLLSGLSVLLFSPMVTFHEGLFVALGMSVLSSGSFVYHYIKTKPIYLFDWYAMMFCLTIITGVIADNEIVWYALIAWQFVYSYFIMGKVDMGGNYNVPILGKITIPDKVNVFVEVAMSMIPCLLVIFLHRSIETFAIITGILLIAIWIRSKDPDPTQAKFHDSWQHGVWHILTAIDLALPAFLS